MKDKTKSLIFGVLILGGVLAILLTGAPSSEDESVTIVTNEQGEEVEDVRPEPIENPLLDKAELFGVVDGQSSGEAFREFDETKAPPNNFEHSIRAELPELKAETFYEGWLVRGEFGDENFEFISTGKMTEDVKYPGTYNLVFFAEVDFREYNNVVVTLEEVDDSSPEEHILEGAF